MALKGFPEPIVGCDLKVGYFDEANLFREATKSPTSLHFFFVNYSNKFFILESGGRVTISMLHDLANVINHIGNGTREVPDVQKILNSSIICPEIYNGPAEGFQEKCSQNYRNRKSQLFTVLMDVRDWSSSDLFNLPEITGNITAQYPGVKIKIGINDDSIYKPNSESITIDTFSLRQSNKEVWNILINDSPDTEFILLTRNLTSWDGYSDITRLLRVLLTYPNIAAAGGSIRNTDTKWYPDCHQLTLQAYGLKVEYGYDNSLEECMLCDYTSSTLLVRKKLANDLFHTNIPTVEVGFLDFSLSLKTKGLELLMCPDVMFYQSFTAPLNVTKDNLLPFIRKWQLDTVILPSETITYSCQDLNFKCAAITVTRSYLLPKCCVLEMASALSFVDQFVRKYNIPYKIMAGLTLGAVKFNGFLPWDLDGDVWFHDSSFFTFVQHKSEFGNESLIVSHMRSPKKVKVNFTDSALFKIFTPSGLSIDMPGVFGKLADSIRNKQDLSLVAFNGVWLRADKSPGLFARNRFGKNCLKHSQSYKILGIKLGEHYDGGKFTKCEQRSHHSCLDHFPADGNRNYYLT